MGYNVDRLEPLADGKAVEVEESIVRAAALLKSAKNVVIFGLANLDSEAQKAAFELAAKIPSTAGNLSIFGSLFKEIQRGNVKTTTLDYVRDRVDTIIYWGSDPSNSHPRHLSRFTYYPRGKFRQRGWEEDRYLIIIDVRDSATSRMYKKFLKIKPGDDTELMRALLDALDGKLPETSLDKKTLMELASQLKKSKYGVICTGAGLAGALNENLDLFKQLLQKLNQGREFFVIPMLDGSNAFGFEKLIQEKGINSSPELLYDVLVNGRADLALIVKSDPLSELPNPLAKSLLKIPLIVIDSHKSLTSSRAKITIPSAVTSVETGCSLYRMDGLSISSEKIFESKNYSDAGILIRIMEELE